MPAWEKFLVPWPFQLRLPKLQIYEDINMGRQQRVVSAVKATVPSRAG